MWVWVGETLLGGMVPDVARYLPATAGFGALGLNPDAMLGWSAGIAVLAGWAVVAVAAGALLMRRGDLS